MRPKRERRHSRRKRTQAPDRHAPSFGAGASARHIRSARKRPSRKKRGWFWRWVLRIIVIVCLLSALPMVALRFIDPPTSSFIQLNKMNNNSNIKHQWTDFDDISLYFPNAVIASEDQQFPDHFGFDMKQIKLVLETGQARGASTITQQTVKNLFLWPGRSFVRKGIEAWLALWMELIVPKRRILELYVNFAQFGKSVFGIGAASEYYFNIPARQLNAQQSALIAASLPTPSRSNPAKPSPYLKQRADFILDQMPRVGGRNMVKLL